MINVRWKLTLVSRRLHVGDSEESNPLSWKQNIARRSRSTSKAQTQAASERQTSESSQWRFTGHVTFYVEVPMQPIQHAGETSLYHLQHLRKLVHWFPRTNGTCSIGRSPLIVHPSPIESLPIFAWRNMNCSHEFSATSLRELLCNCPFDGPVCKVLTLLWSTAIKIWTSWWWLCSQAAVSSRNNDRMMPVEKAKSPYDSAQTVMQHSQYPGNLAQLPILL